MSAKLAVDRALARQLKQALPVAVAAATEAGEFIARRFGRFRDIKRKADRSLVTEVDRGSERIVTRKLRARFPNDHIIGEETGLNEGQHVSSFRWHVDPLDGTTNFVHGFPFFCVSIGLEFEQRDLVLGVIYQPIGGNLYAGFSGGGAFLNRRPMKVSKTKQLSQALLSTGFSMKREKYFRDEIASFASLTAASDAVRRTGSAALDIVCVAAGQFDGFWERGLHSWDMAAGLALLKEAGGQYSRMDGRPLTLDDESVLASNGLLHAQIRKTAMLRQGRPAAEAEGS